MSAILRCLALLGLLLTAACAGQEANQILTRVAQNTYGFQMVTPPKPAPPHGGSQVAEYVDVQNGGRIALILANQAQPQATSFDTPWARREFGIVVLAGLQTMARNGTTRLRPAMNFRYGDEDVMRCAPIVVERPGGNLLGLACLTLPGQRPANFLLAALERPDTTRRAELLYLALRRAVLGQDAAGGQFNTEPDALPVPEADVAPVPEVPPARRG